MSNARAVVTRLVRALFLTNAIKKMLLECEAGLENAVRDEADVEDEEEYNDDGIK